MDVGGPPELLSRPVETVRLFARLVAGDLLRHARRFSRGVALLAAAGLIAAGLRWVPAARPLVEEAQRRVLFALFWLLLGVLSSIGMGSGLHTFVLYLAPKAARYVLTSWECGALAEMEESRWALFPRFECPPGAEGRADPDVMGLLRVLQWEGLLWGLGTTLGELPPFLLSRSARLAKGPAAPRPAARAPTGRLARAARFAKTQLKRHPFATILLLASFPNPFFDACGLICGYNLVPFWLFFAATLLGKAVVKVNLQLLALVVVFSRGCLDGLLAALEAGPLRALGAPLRAFVDRQRAELAGGGSGGHASSPLSQLWNALLLVIVLFYAGTLVNARVARSHAAPTAPLTARARLE